MPTNPPSAAERNVANRLFWAEEQRRTEEAQGNRSVGALAFCRVAQSAKYILLAIDDHDRIERTRHARSWEQEVTDAAAAFDQLPLAETQKERARRPRVKVGRDDAPVSDLIRDLATCPEHSEESARELWPHLFAVLDEAGCAPEEIVHGSDPRKTRYEYEAKKGRRKISYGQFANQVAKFRKERKIRLAG